MSEVRAERGCQVFGLERLNALSDGLFAIVLTLLVLELKLPETADPGHILDDLGDDYHAFVAWLISFIVIARFWLIHHGITARMSHCHVGTIALTLLLLAFVSLMPFTAALIGSYEVGEPWSTVFFATNLAAGSIALGVLARHVSREPKLLRPETEDGELDWHRRHHLYVLPAVAVAAVGLAFVEPWVAIGIMPAVAVAAVGLAFVEPWVAIGIMLAEFGLVVARGFRQV